MSANFLLPGLVLGPRVSRIYVFICMLYACFGNCTTGSRYCLLPWIASKVWNLQNSASAGRRSIRGRPPISQNVFPLSSVVERVTSNDEVSRSSRLEGIEEGSMLFCQSLSSISRIIRHNIFILHSKNQNTCTVNPRQSSLN